MDPLLSSYERALRRHFAGLDLEHWWPARTRFEMIAGALLVQNTNWRNVTRALTSLRTAGRLSVAGVRRTSEAELGLLIRSAGTWRQKARRLRGFVDWLDAEHGGSLTRLFALPTAEARRQLLGLEGIGEETADAMLTFAGGHGSFIVDAYTRRIFARHHLPVELARTHMRQLGDAPSASRRPLPGIAARTPSDHRQRPRQKVASHLSQHQACRDWHALLVETAKRYCRKQDPRCGLCPLQPFLPGLP